MSALRRHLDRDLQVRAIFLKDFYPLTPWSDDPAEWLAFQFHDPESGTGLVQIFGGKLANRASPPPLKLRGLDPDASYAVSNWDAPDAEAVFRGADLLHRGLPRPAGELSSAVVLPYARVPPRPRRSNSRPDAASGRDRRPRSR